MGGSQKASSSSREGSYVFDVILKAIVAAASEFPEEFMLRRSRLLKTLRECERLHPQYSAPAYPVGLQQEKDTNLSKKGDGGRHGFNTEDEVVSGLQQQTMSSSDGGDNSNIEKIKNLRKIRRRAKSEKKRKMSNYENESTRKKKKM